MNENMSVVLNITNFSIPLLYNYDLKFHLNFTIAPKIKLHWSRSTHSYQNKPPPSGAPTHYYQIKIYIYIYIPPGYFQNA